MENKATIFLCSLKGVVRLQTGQSLKPKQIHLHRKQSGELC